MLGYKYSNSWFSCPRSFLRTRQSIRNSVSFCFLLSHPWRWSLWNCGCICIDSKTFDSPKYQLLSSHTPACVPGPLLLVSPPSAAPPAPPQPEHCGGGGFPAAGTELALSTGRLIYVHAGKSTDALMSKHGAQGLATLWAFRAAGLCSSRGRSRTRALSGLAVVTG